MKLSAIFVSVNIAATLPVAIAGAAFASDEAKSDKANWLKSSLASLDTSANHKKTAHSAKMSYSVPAPEASLHSGGVKLRPFMANRRLPSQHDLDVQFIAQTAKMASAEPAPTLTAQSASMDAEPQPLAGRVSEVYSSYPTANVASYGSVGYVKQSSSRVVPGQNPSVPGQIRQFRSAGRPKYVAKTQMPAQSQQRTLQDELDAQYPVQQQQQPVPRMARVTANEQFQQAQQVQQMQHMQQMQQMQQAMQQMQGQGSSEPEAQQQPGGISSEEQSIIDRMIAGAHGAGGDAAGSEMSPSAGPPPFPLSLLPQDQLKSMVQGLRRQKTDAAPSYFGSWRGNTMASLPASGFHNYAPHSGSSAGARIGSKPSVKVGGTYDKASDNYRFGSFRERSFQ